MGGEEDHFLNMEVQEWSTFLDHLAASFFRPTSLIWRCRSGALFPMKVQEWSTFFFGLQVVAFKCCGRVFTGDCTDITV